MNSALLQNWLGLESLPAFLSDVDQFTVHWVSPSDHAAAVRDVSAEHS